MSGPAGHADHAAAQLAEVKPRLRGWLHACTAPLTLAAGVLLVLLSPAGLPRLGSTVFAASALVLFTVSATMHRGRWSPRTELLLTRLDHASIFLLIAGTYTPFSLLLLDGADRVVLLAMAWGGAALRHRLPAAPPAGGALGLHPGLPGASAGRRSSSPATSRSTAAGRAGLLALGGLLYTAGGVVYGLRRPNPFPQWFGFHEVFHAFTVVAFAAHYAGISVATYALR